MKLWVDEDLSPTLIEVAHARGLDAACNRDRGMLGGSDLEVLRRCIEEDRTLVTANTGDFRRLCETHEAHPGLIVLPRVSRSAQQHVLACALGYIEHRATKSDAADAAEFMISRVVEVNADGHCRDFPLPDRE